MAKTRRQRIAERAQKRCEYCRVPAAYDVLPFQIDHIRAQKHEGDSSLANLAYACFACNSFKGPNAAGYDPTDDSLQRLFNPRSDQWQVHFRWDGAEIIGLTPIGRATIAVLRLNDADRVEHRRLLMRAGAFQ